MNPETTIDWTKPIHGGYIRNVLPLPVTTYLWVDMSHTTHHIGKSDVARDSLIESKAAFRDYGFGECGELIGFIATTTYPDGRPTTAIFIPAV